MISVYEERLKRFSDVVAMRPVDKIPVSVNGPAYIARSQKILLKDYITDYPRAVQAGINLFHQLETADFIQTPIICPHVLSSQWLSPIALPGKELPDDALWQVKEQETLKYEDYERVLKDGFMSFYDWVLTEKLNDVNSKLTAFSQYGPIAKQKMTDAGIPVINDCAPLVQPFEYFCGGRGLMNFFCEDLFEKDYMKAVFDKTMEDLIPYYKKLLSESRPLGAWVGGWRSAPCMLSDEMFDTFVWPYMKQIAEAVLEAGVVPIFHLDSNWDRMIHRFLEFPEHTCIISLDGTTDIKRARQVLGGHSCLMGDVPAQMQAFGTADEVYRYTTDIIEACGPETGLIVCSGCDIAPNAKDENIKAMVDAAADFLH